MEVLTSREFDLLVELEAHPEICKTPAVWMEKLHFTESEGNQAFQHLLELGFVDETATPCVTESGYTYLEPHKVKRAVLLAAGFGQRMRPVTLERPKPLVSVNGTIIIETLLDALMEKGIRDITIVTGYLGEHFACIRDKYPNIRFFHNDKFSSENNISSAMLVRSLYSNAYVMDADLYLKNRDLIRKYEYCSNYLGVPVEQTDDWCFEMQQDKVTSMKRGGENTYLMVGLSYWTKEAGEMFAQDIQNLYATEEGKQCFWDDVVLTHYNDHYDIRVRPCTATDIVEIDSVAELAAVDHSYDRYL